VLASMYTRPLFAAIVQLGCFSCTCQLICVHLCCLSL
jgi:hypothetical protein